ncbi:MAG TPA: hypothetical protein VNO30_46390 [Kofleriaceae bacterium]|nr:hypothetical protein [Kofleriaceae bacterium]
MARGALLLGGLACTACGARAIDAGPAPLENVPATPANAPAGADTPPCFRLFPLAPGASWTYDVELTSSTNGVEQHARARVVRTIASVTRDPAGWHFRVDNARLPEDSAVEATEHFLLADALLYDGNAASPENLRLVAAPEEQLAWGGPPGFFPPGQGVWTLEDIIDAPPRHACARVRARLEYGEIVHVYCPEVGPITSEYHERVPRSRYDGRLGHGRDELWRLRDFSPGRCAR